MSTITLKLWFRKDYFGCWYFYTNFHVTSGFRKWLAKHPAVSRLGNPVLFDNMIEFASYADPKKVQKEILQAFRDRMALIIFPEESKKKEKSKGKKTKEKK